MVTFKGSRRSSKKIAMRQDPKIHQQEAADKKIAVVKESLPSPSTHVPLSLSV